MIPFTDLVEQVLPRAAALVSTTIPSMLGVA